MRHVRAVLRVLGMLVVTGALFPFLIAGRTVRRRQRVIGIWARAMARCLSLHVTVEGTPPAGGFVLVSNHVSYLDILLYLQVVDIVFVAMSQLRKVPVIRTIVASAGTIFIDRSSKRDALRVVGEIESIVQRGGGVVLFPEATSSDGSDVLPFKPALLEAAVREGRPVHYAVIRYRQPGIAWWGDIPLIPQLIGLLGKPRIDATLQFCGAVTAPDRRELARRLWLEIRQRVTAAS